MFDTKVTLTKLIDKTFNHFTKSYYERIVKYYANKYKIKLTYDEFSESTHTILKKGGREILLGYRTYPSFKQLPLDFEVSYVEGKSYVKDIGRFYKALTLHELAHNYYTDMVTHKKYMEKMFSENRLFLSTLFMRISNIIEDCTIEKEFAFNYPSTKKYFDYLVEFVCPPKSKVSDEEMLNNIRKHTGGNPVSEFLSFIFLRYRGRSDFPTNSLYKVQQKFYDEAFHICLTEMDSTLRLQKTLALAFEMAKYLIEGEQPDITKVYAGVSPMDLRKLIPKKTDSDKGSTKSSAYDSDLSIESDEKGEGNDGDSNEERDGSYNGENDNDSASSQSESEESRDDHSGDGNIMEGSVDGNEEIEVDREGSSNGTDEHECDIDDSESVSSEQDEETSSSSVSESDNGTVDGDETGDVLTEETEIDTDTVIKSITDLFDVDVQTDSSKPISDAVHHDVKEEQELEDYDSVNTETQDKIIRRAFGEDFGNIDDFAHNFFRIKDYIDDRTDRFALERYEADRKKVENFYEDIQAVFFDKVANRYEKWANDMQSGVINRRDLINENKYNVFKQKIERTKKLDVDFMFIVDQSGSMYGKKTKVAGLGITAIAEALSSIAGKFSIYSFTGDDARIADTIEFKSFEDDYESVAHYISLYTHNAIPSPLRGFHGNCDEVNLDFLHQKFLTESIATHKIMIVLSDGGTTNSEELLSQVANDIELDGIEIYSIGILDRTVLSVYNNARVITELDDLPEALFEIVDKNILN